jgi:hypothetical protein
MNNCEHSAQSWYIDKATGRRGCSDCDDDARAGLTRKQVADTIDALIARGEHNGSEGDYRTDPLSDPLIMGAFRLLRHTYQTHADGMTGMLRVMRAITSRVFRLDER